MVCAVRKIVIWESKLFFQGSFYSNILIDERTNLSQIAIYVSIKINMLFFGQVVRIDLHDFSKEDKHKYLFPLL